MPTFNCFYFCCKALKYWRFRVFLLPLHNSATRKILEGSSRCDIYTSPSNAEQASLMDGFLRFIEGWLNKIRRPNPNKNWVTLPLLISGRFPVVTPIIPRLLVIPYSENSNCTHYNLIVAQLYYIYRRRSKKQLHYCDRFDGICSYFQSLDSFNNFT